MSALQSRVLVLLLAAVAAVVTGVSPASAAEPETTDIGVTNTCDPSGNGPNETKTRSEILARAQRWVDIDIPLTYNAGACHSDTYGKYRRDCSGLLAMAWGLEKNLVSDSSAGSPDNFMTYAANHNGMYFITRNELQPGDALVRSGHVELFSHWEDPGNPSTSAAYVYSFNTTGETVQNPYKPTNMGNLGKNSSADVNSYRYVRYQHIVDELGRVSTVAQSDGTVDVFWKGADGGLWHRWFAYGTWYGPESMGAGTLGSDPVAVVSAPGVIDVFWRGTNNSLWSKRFTSSSGWSTHVDHGGSITGVPAVTGQPDGTVDVFWKGTNGGLWHRWFAYGTWYGPENMGNA